MSKHLPINEITRVELVQDLLDEYDDNSKFYESFTTLIASYFKCPMAAVTLVDSDKVHYFATVGLDMLVQKEISRADAFDSITIFPESAEIIQVPDASKDFRFQTSKIVTGFLSLRFYAGMAIQFNGIKIGTLCIMDTLPHPELDEDKKSQLRFFGSLFNDVVKTRFEKKLSFDDQFAKQILVGNMKEIKNSLTILLKNKEEFDNVMKLLSSNKASMKSATTKLHSTKQTSSLKNNNPNYNSSSNNNTSECNDSPMKQQQDILMSIDSLQSLIRDQSKALHSCLQHSYVMMNCLKNMMEETIQYRQFPSITSDGQEGHISMNDWIRRFKKSLQLTRSQENFIKFELDENNDTNWKVYDLYQEHLSALVSLYIPISLLKWKNMKFSLQILDENGQYRRSSGEFTKGLSKPECVKSSIVLEMACFHRSNTSNFKDEIMMNLLDELMIKTMELFQGSYERTITSSSDTFKFIFQSSIYLKPQKSQRRSLFFRNSIQFFLEEGNLFERAIFGGLHKSSSQQQRLQQQQNHDLGVGKPLVTDLTPSTAQVSNSSLNGTCEKKKKLNQVDNNHVLDESLPKNKKGIAEGGERSSLSRQGSSRGRVKGNILHSFLNSLIGRSQLKRSIIVPSN